MLKVGITGGIGSGKSLISEIFALLGAPVYDSDKRAKEIMHDNEEVRRGVIDEFGAESYNDDGSLNRQHIASQVFSDDVMLGKLNAIVHPAVGTDFEYWCDRHADSPYIIKEAALVFEAGINTSLDKVILVFAPEGVRISRVMQRDQIDEESVRNRIANQWSDEKKAPLSDFVIVNDGNESLLRQALEIHNFLLQCAQNPAK
jgi:dephospho-CoA kinase